MQFYIIIDNDGYLGLLEIQSLSYDTASGILTCISTGGPVTNLTWNRSGGSYSQSKIIVDTANGTYHNLLYISSNTLSDYTGIFSCIVENDKSRVFMTTQEFKSKHNFQYLCPSEICCSYSKL